MRHEAYDMETPLSHSIIPNLGPIDGINEEKEFSNCNCNKAQAFRFHNNIPLSRRHNEG